MHTRAAIQHYKLYHIAVWAAIFGLWYFFRYQDYPGHGTALAVTFIKVADLALMAYIANYLLIPRLLYAKKYLLFAIVFAALVLATSWLKMWVEGQVMHDADTFDLFKHFKSNFYDNTIPHFLLVSTAAAFKLLFDYAKAQRRLGEMAKENAEAELNFLKSQINPHFVFNSLNSVYFLIDKQNEDARDALHKFSGMLRYQLYECNGSKTSIEKETAYLRDYIDMQRVRRDDNCRISFTVGASVKGFFVESLLFIPFVENAFKHLSHFANSSNDVDIALGCEGDVLALTVSNTTEPKDETVFNGPKGGIGLKNVKRRLELLYPDRHALDIKSSENLFEVVLKISLNGHIITKSNA